MTDDDVRSRADERRRLLNELELERKQLIRNIETCRIRDIDRPFIGARSLREIVAHCSAWEGAVADAVSDLRRGRPHATDGLIGSIECWVDGPPGSSAPFWQAIEELSSGRARLHTELAGLSDEDLMADGSVFLRLLTRLVAHDREHWHEIAAVLAGMAGTRKPELEKTP